MPPGCIPKAAGGPWAQPGWAPCHPASGGCTCTRRPLWGRGRAPLFAASTPALMQGSSHCLSSSLLPREVTQPQAGPHWHTGPCHLHWPGQVRAHTQTLAHMYVHMHPCSSAAGALWDRGRCPGSGFPHSQPPAHLALASLPAQPALPVPQAEHVGQLLSPQRALGPAPTARAVPPPSN